MLKGENYDSKTKATFSVNSNVGDAEVLFRDFLVIRIKTQLLSRHKHKKLLFRIAHFYGTSKIVPLFIQATRHDDVWGSGGVLACILKPGIR